MAGGIWQWQAGMRLAMYIFRDKYILAMYQRQDTNEPIYTALCH